MTPEQLARLHARAFAPARGWRTAEFQTLLEAPEVILVHADQGFALARVTLDEAELLTIATDPDDRRGGIATRLLRDLLLRLQNRGATTLFLEVAADNIPARALYDGFGFSAVGHRKGYYARNGAAPVDALVLRLDLKPDCA